MNALMAPGRSHGRRVRSLAIALLALFVVPTLVAELPRARDPKAYTQHDYVRDSLVFERQFHVEAYKSSGRRDAKWDDAALAALDASARHWCAARLHNMVRPKGTPTIGEVGKLGDASVQLGCDDPIVLHVLATALEMHKSHTRARELAPRIVEAMQKAGFLSGQGAYHLLNAAARAERYAAADDKPRFHAIALEAAARATVGPFVNGAHRRRLLENLDAFSPRANWQEREQLYQKVLLQKEADPWVINVFGGRCLIAAAWRARGSGAANTVTPEGWKGFSEKLEEARICLSKAWQLHPDLPEAPTDMITVAMGHGDDGEDPRKWFDRAISAQLDYERAFDTMFQALMPRWGGSHGQMIALGLEARQTQRYDTMLPWHFIEALERVNGDSTKDYRVFNDARLYSTVLEVLRQYTEKFKDDPAMADWYRTYHAALAWRLAKFDEARTVLESTTRAQQGPFERFGIATPMGIGQVYVMTSPAKTQFRRASERQRAGDHDGAANAYDEALKAAEGEELALIHIRAARAVNDWRTRFEKGEWVDILPKPDFNGWLIHLGDARIADDGQMVELVSDGNLATLLCEGSFGRRYEVEAVFDRPEGDARGGGAIHAEYRSDRDGHVLWVRHDGKAGRRIATGRFVEQSATIARPTRANLKLWDGASAASVNGQPLPVEPEAPAQVSATVGRIAITAFYASAGSTTRFMELKVRKLTKRPEGLRGAQ